MVKLPGKDAQGVSAGKNKKRMLQTDPGAGRRLLFRLNGRWCFVWGHERWVDARLRWTHVRVSKSANIIHISHIFSITSCAYVY